MGNICCGGRDDDVYTPKDPRRPLRTNQHWGGGQLGGGGDEPSDLTARERAAIAAMNRNGGGNTNTGGSKRSSQGETREYKGIDPTPPLTTTVEQSDNAPPRLHGAGDEENPLLAAALKRSENSGGGGGISKGNQQLMGQIDYYYSVLREDIPIGIGATSSTEVLKTHLVYVKERARSKGVGGK